MSAEAQVPSSRPGFVESRLEGVHDFVVFLSALQLREKDKEQWAHCEANARGLKFSAHTVGKDVEVFGWMFSDSFKDYAFTGEEEAHLKLPLSSLLNCLQIFSDRALLTLQYPYGPSDDIRLVLEEDHDVTECRIRTMRLDEAPTPISSFFIPSNTMCTFKPILPESWHFTLSEFAEYDAPDVVLQVVLRSGAETAVLLRAQNMTSDIEVELSRASLSEFELSADMASRGEVMYKYHLTSVLTCCLRAAKDARAVKVRFSREGVMSNQFILRGRGQRDLFCESLVCSLADAETSGGGTVNGHVN